MLKVTHKAPKEDPSHGSMKHDVWHYRTEVANTGKVPIRIIWFESYFEHHGCWCGGNIKNSVLREKNFDAWYAEGDRVKNGWLKPGQVAACDPNWHWAPDEKTLGRLKWCFMAVDKKGKSHFAEAVVTKRAARHYAPPKAKTQKKRKSKK